MLRSTESNTDRKANTIYRDLLCRATGAIDRLKESNSVTVKKIKHLYDTDTTEASGMTLQINQKCPIVRILCHWICVYSWGYCYTLAIVLHCKKTCYFFFMRVAT